MIEPLGVRKPTQPTCRPAAAPIRLGVLDVLAEVEQRVQARSHVVNVVNVEELDLTVAIVRLALVTRSPATRHAISYTLHKYARYLSLSLSLTYLARLASAFNRGRASNT